MDARPPLQPSDVGQCPAPSKPPTAGSSAFDSSSADMPTRVSASGSPAPREAHAAQVAGYELLEEIHRGGQGVVYRARQLGTKREVALKVLLEGPFASEAARRRFEREIELAASLRHPSIVTILDSGISDGRYFFAMSFIHGKRLDQHLRDARPPLDATLRLFERICEAVTFAHQRGVIHRDLKPSNILVDSDGQPYVLDFGLAKAARHSDAYGTTLPAVSVAGQVIGTVAYMSPEQARGSEDVDVRSDVYSIGVMLYEALLERPPYPVQGPLGDVLHRIVHEDPARPRAIRASCRFGRQIDDELETIALKALEKEPERRYASARQLGTDLQRYQLGEPIEAKRASGLYVLRKTLRRYRLQAASAAVLLLMLLAFLANFAWQYRVERGLREAAAGAANTAKARELEASEARRAAEESARHALAAAEQRRLALVRQNIQRGDLAQLRDELDEARDAYWQAYLDGEATAGARWALRQYYLRSGDVGAMQLFYRSYGPLAISRDAALAAVCDAPAMITVREVRTARTVMTVAIPDEARAIYVGSQGALAAAGRGWVRYWRSGSAEPLLTASSSEWQAPSDIGVSADGRYLFVIDQDSAFVTQTEGNTGFRSLALPGASLGAAAIASHATRIAVPTTRGVARIDLAAPAGRAVTLLPAARGEPPARAVAFGENDALLQLTPTAILEQTSSDPKARARVAAPLAAPWDRLDAAENGNILLWAADGRAALYRAGAAVAQWRIAQSGLLAARLSPSGTLALTVDDGGALTEWEPLRQAAFQRAIVSSPALAWTASADGSSLLLVMPDGTAAYYRPQRSPTPDLLHLPGLSRSFGGGSSDDYSLALTRDGLTGTLRYRRQVWAWRADVSTGPPARWWHERAPVLRDVAISDDGRWLAFQAQSEAGDSQFVFLLSAARVFNVPGPLQRQIARFADMNEFVGSAIRDIAFLPESDELLILRSNGQLLRLQARAGDGEARKAPSSRASLVWAELDAAPRAYAFHAAAGLAAFACEDGVIRLLDRHSGASRGQILAGREIAAVCFSPGGDLVLTRQADGSVQVFDVAARERITQWTLSSGANAPLAAWLDDALALNGPDAVQEVQQSSADEVIQRSRQFALERRIGAALTVGDAWSAWDDARRIEPLDPVRAGDAGALVLESLLRRARSEIPQEWLAEVLANGSLPALMRSGHAAYDGGRFDLARDLLRRAATVAGQRIDAYTRWRLAACSYLLDPPAQAADQLADVLKRTDLEPQHAAYAMLQEVAALVLSGRADDARAALAEALESRPNVSGAEGAGVLASIAIGHYLIGEQPESQLADLFRRLLSSFGEKWLPYSDDFEFFAGELARRSGDLDGARVRYQRCVDTAQDEWPANWARFRLRQLTP